VQWLFRCPLSPGDFCKVALLVARAFLRECFENLVKKDRRRDELGYPEIEDCFSFPLTVFQLVDNRATGTPFTLH
jgi:hypothetical protein